MSLPRPTLGYCSRADLIWPVGTKKSPRLEEGPQIFDDFDFFFVEIFKSL
jgi:hypothetical protein